MQCSVVFVLIREIEQHHVYQHWNAVANPKNLTSKRKAKNGEKEEENTNGWKHNLKKTKIVICFDLHGIFNSFERKTVLLILISSFKLGMLLNIFLNSNLFLFSGSICIPRWRRRWWYWWRWCWWCRWRVNRLWIVSSTCMNKSYSWSYSSVFLFNPSNHEIDWLVENRF